MSTPVSKPKKRLNREGWLHAALDLLAAEGIGSVTIDGIAHGLNITRGSFYHHFENRQDLLTAMLEYWMQRWTVEIHDSIKVLDLNPEIALMSLIKLIRAEKAAARDAAVRAWALGDKLASQYVRQADKVRLDYIRSLFEAIGFEGNELESRARMFLYYEAFEPMMLEKSDPKTEKNLIALRHRLLTNRSK
jgi:AcrR family transcriptional regulator